MDIILVLNSHWIFKNDKKRILSEVFERFQRIKKIEYCQIEYHDQCEDYFVKNKFALLIKVSKPSIFDAIIKPLSESR